MPRLHGAKPRAHTRSTGAKALNGGAAMRQA